MSRKEVLAFIYYLIIAPENTWQYPGSIYFCSDPRTIDSYAFLSNMLFLAKFISLIIKKNRNCTITTHNSMSI